jgi:hypothetical protein
MILHASVLSFQLRFESDCPFTCFFGKRELAWPKSFNSFQSPLIRRLEQMFDPSAAARRFEVSATADGLQFRVVAVCYHQLLWTTDVRQVALFVGLFARAQPTQETAVVANATASCPGTS